MLMARPGHVAKREIMAARCPVLLNKGFLLQAKACMQAALEDNNGAGQGGRTAREELLERGLFFLAKETPDGTCLRHQLRTEHIQTLLQLNILEQRIFGDLLQPGIHLQRELQGNPVHRLWFARESGGH